MTTMYQYDHFDKQFVDQRVDEFRDQVARRLSGELTEEQFKPLRLMNGLYLQLHAYMLRVAIPYGILSATQMRRLAHIARRYDKGYGHFTTRQNVQFNWPKLEEVPDLLEELAAVDMHAIQTSGNCIRNVTTDQFAGAAADEIDDPRIYAELLRQWSSLHPEFSFLPRKFKIALTGAVRDRAAIKVHDIGLGLTKDAEGNRGFEVWVGGGLGRTPIIGKQIRNFLPEADLLAYVEAILRVYNLHGRRDNKYKARIKILVNALGIEALSEQVEEEFIGLQDGPLALDHREVNRIRGHFGDPDFRRLQDNPEALSDPLALNPEFARWHRTNVSRHKTAGYVVATISLKPAGGIPGDATAGQMDAVARLAEDYSFSELRVAHEQNLVLPHVEQGELFALWRGLKNHELASANVGQIGDIIACPGLDFCALANARSIPIAQEISQRLSDPEKQEAIGNLTLNISGCINACGHHHIGNIGILGVDKRGEEYYQVTLGGKADENAAIGQIVGPAFSSDEIAGAVEKIVETYLQNRQLDEKFIETYQRIGAGPFKEDLYGTA